MAHIGERLREAMRASGVSVASVAKLCDVSEAAVYGWFKTGRIKKAHLPQLARHVGLTTDALLGHDGGVGVQTSLTVEIAAVELPRDAIEVARAWMVLPENERNDFRRKIEMAALRYRDNVPDARLKEWGKSPATSGTAKKPPPKGTQ